LRAVKTGVIFGFLRPRTRAVQQQLHVRALHQ